MIQERGIGNGMNNEMNERCYRCGIGSSLFFSLFDHYNNRYLWCPGCVYKLMAANEQYHTGEFRGDQDKHQNAKATQN